MPDKVADPLIGRQLANFLLEEVIGRGGMAIVYYGKDVKLNRPVAVKVIDARYRDNPVYAERFIRESQVVATWRHPNVLQVYYADDEDDLYYFVMEYVDGLDLRKLVDMYGDEGQLMPLEDVLRIGYAVADALDYAHARGVIHRDVKPSNVMVSHDGRVLLMDFGLALQVTEGSLGEVFGTPHYMAPEQARRSADAVPASDLYSLGVLLFEMLTGSVPFDDSSPTSVAIQHITQPPPSPRSFNPALNQPTEDVLLKALEKQSGDRYQSGHELMEELEKALKEGAEEYQSDALPPLPAPVYRTSTGSTAPKLSDMTVAQKMFLQMGNRLHLPTELEPPTFRQKLFNKAKELIHNPYIIGGVVALLALMSVAGGYFVAGGNMLVQPTLVPTEPVVVAVAPTNTPTVTSTAVTTATPTFTPTTTTTVTATTTPTLTATPTVTSSPTTAAAVLLTPSATPQPSLLLIYNRTGFYVLNISSRSINLDPLTFNAIDQEGNSTRYSFQAVTGWPLKRLSPGFCGGIELAGISSNLQPTQCEGFGMLTFPGATSDEYFWADRFDEGITEFRVGWFGDTVKVCQIIDGLCSISLP